MHTVSTQKDLTPRLTRRDERWLPAWKDGRCDGRRAPPCALSSSKTSSTRPSRCHLHSVVGEGESRRLTEIGVVDFVRIRGELVSEGVSDFGKRKVTVNTLQASHLGPSGELLEDTQTPRQRRPHGCRLKRMKKQSGKIQLLAPSTASLSSVPRPSQDCRG